MHAEEKYLTDFDLKAEKSISDLKEIKSGMMVHKSRMEIFLKNSRENQPDVRQHTRENSSNCFYQIQRNFTTGSNFTLAKDSEIRIAETKIFLIQML